MLNYGVLSKNPLHFRNFSGLQLQEFETLNLKIEEKYPAYEQKRLAREDRKRAVGAGHPFTLPLKDRLLMLLLYYHMYPSSTLLGYLLLPQPNWCTQRRKKARTTRARNLASAKKAVRQGQAAAKHR